MWSNKTEQRAELTRAAELLGLCNGRITEVRVLGCSTISYKRPHTEAGYFDNVESLVESVLSVSESADGIYILPNPPTPALLARAANRLRPLGQRDPLTADSDIIHREWFMVDVDPVRPAGICSTDEEIEAAMKLAAEIRRDLLDKDWPEPIVACSGNGSHLLWRVKLPTQDDITHAVLETLNAKWSTESLKVDTTVANPARIWKLYGTWTRKGDNIASRPHRRSFLVQVPEQLYLVPRFLLEQESTVPVDTDAIRDDISRHPESRQPKMHPRKGGFDLESWMTQNFPDAQGPERWKDGQKWVFGTCPFQPDAHRNGSAFVIQQSDGAIGAGCHHNSCSWDWHALREKIDGSLRDRIPALAVDDDWLPKVKGRTLDKALEKWQPLQIRDRSHAHLAMVFGWELCRWSDGVPLVYDQDRLYRYNPELGIWEVVPDGEVARLMCDRDLEEYVDAEGELKTFRVSSSGMVQSVQSLIHQRAAKPGFFMKPETGGLQTENGFLVVSRDGARLRESGPDRKQIIRLDLPWLPDVKPGRWSQALDEWFGDDDNGRQKAGLLQEFYGACLFGLAPSYGKVLFLLGRGSNGKSVAIKVLSELLPPELWCAMPPHLWTNSNTPEYYLAHLEGKRLNVCADISSAGIMRSEEFKKIVTGDTLLARRPAGQPFELAPMAGHIFSANELPTSRDHSEGFWRRILALSFDIAVSEDRKDTQLADRIIASEGPAVLNWAVEGAVRLIKRGKYAIPEKSLELVQKWRIESDSVRSFIMDNYGFDHDGPGIKASELYEDYRHYCDDNGNKPCSNVIFRRRVEDMGGEVKRKRDGNYYNLSEKNPWDVVDV